MAYNVQRFPKAREPTVRAVKGFPPPFRSIHFHCPRWQGAQRRRGKRVLGAVGLAGSPAHCLRFSGYAARLPFNSKVGLSA
jgi:hypothetical protein